jgi:hypothetical protein
MFRPEGLNYTLICPTLSDLHNTMLGCIFTEPIKDQWRKESVVIVNFGEYLLYQMSIIAGWYCQKIKGPEDDFKGESPVLKRGEQTKSEEAQVLTVEDELATAEEKVEFIVEDEDKKGKKKKKKGKSKKNEAVPEATPNLLGQKSIYENVAKPDHLLSSDIPEIVKHTLHMLSMLSTALNSLKYENHPKNPPKILTDAIDTTSKAMESINSQTLLFNDVIELRNQINKALNIYDPITVIGSLQETMKASRGEFSKKMAVLASSKKKMRGLHLPNLLPSEVHTTIFKNMRKEVIKVSLPTVTSLQVHGKKGVLKCPGYFQILKSYGFRIYMTETSIAWEPENKSLHYLKGLEGTIFLKSDAYLMDFIFDASGLLLRIGYNYDWGEDEAEEEVENRIEEAIFYMDLMPLYRVKCLLEQPESKSRVEELFKEDIGVPLLSMKMLEESKQGSQFGVMHLSKDFICSITQYTKEVKANFYKIMPSKGADISFKQQTNASQSQTSSKLTLSSEIAEIIQDVIPAQLKSPSLEEILKLHEDQLTTQLQMEDGMSDSSGEESFSWTIYSSYDLYIKGKTGIATWSDYLTEETRVKYYVGMFELVEENTEAEEDGKNKSNPGKNGKKKEKQSHEPGEISTRYLSGWRVVSTNRSANWNWSQEEASCNPKNPFTEQAFENGRVMYILLISAMLTINLIAFRKGLFEELISWKTGTYLSSRLRRGLDIKLDKYLIFTALRGDGYIQVLAAPFLKNVWKELNEDIKEGRECVLPKMIMFDIKL